MHAGRYMIVMMGFLRHLRWFDLQRLFLSWTQCFWLRWEFDGQQYGTVEENDKLCQSLTSVLPDLSTPSLDPGPGTFLPMNFFFFQLFQDEALCYLQSFRCFYRNLPQGF
jgi:hypothetical protein